jgi:competence protein ComK
MYRRFIEAYEMNRFTMALIPVFEDKHIYTCACEFGCTFYIPRDPYTVLRENCRYYGSSFEGRKEGTHELIHVCHKPPIIIDPIQNMFAFPTASPESPLAHWCLLSHIRGFTTIAPQQVQVQFTDGQVIHFPISAYSFSKQYHRTALLQWSLFKRSRQLDALMELEYPHGVCVDSYS